MEAFFEIASPATLASLIADIESSGRNWGPFGVLRLQALSLLVANVGDAKARFMIDAACGKSVAA